MSFWEIGIFLILFGAILVAGNWYSGKVLRDREQNLISARSGEGLDTFVASFRAELRPIAHATYLEFQDNTMSRAVPFRKTDVVKEIIPFDEIDLDESFKRVADQFECREPSRDDSKVFRRRRTFEDYVEYMYFLSTKESNLSSPNSGTRS